MSVKLNLDAASSDENSNTKPFMVDPTTLDDGSLRTTTYTTRLARDYFGGYTPIIGSWDESTSTWRSRCNGQLGPLGGARLADRP